MRRYLPFLPQNPLVAVVRLTGVISAGGRPGAGISDQSAAPMLEKAFTRGKPKAVAIVVNSPGGSPVQSSLVAARIRRLADEKDIPVHVFVEDLAASGGYWIAVAGDHIWVDPTSIVGSIGVISASFGLDGLIGRYGIERRVHTAGTSKSFMDPFLPEKPEDVARLKSVQEPMHARFIEHVKSRRGDRLKSETDLFDGSFWIGNDAAELGLVDGIGHLVPKMKELYGDKVRFNVQKVRRPFLARFGMSLAGDAMAAVEERAMLARYGL
ncbi:MAG: S49 family peptidase [Pseudomonadota bacterium]